MKNGKIQISPLALAYLAAVRAGNLHRADAERQVINAAEYILKYGVSACTPDVLRVAAAICEAVAELKEGTHEIQSDSDSLREARQGATAKSRPRPHRSLKRNTRPHRGDPPLPDDAN